MSGEVHPSGKAPAGLAALLTSTIQRLKLNDPRLTTSRGEAYLRYLEFAYVGAEQLAWSLLEQDHPVVARAVALQGLRLV